MVMDGGPCPKPLDPKLTLFRPVQEVLIVPLLPMALVALDEVERNASPLYRYGRPAGGGAGPAVAGPLQLPCCRQRSCRGEVLASRKDFRMNTCTPHPRGAFMLEPVGMSPVEALPPRKGEGSRVGVGVRRGSSRLGSLQCALCPAALVPALWSCPLELVPVSPLPAADSVPGL